MPRNAAEFRKFVERRAFIGGSDARVIMGTDEAALLWPMAGKAWRTRARGPVRQPYCPAGARDRSPQPKLVRAQQRANRGMRSTPAPTSCAPVDGRNARRNDR